VGGGKGEGWGWSLWVGISGGCGSVWVCDSVEFPRIFGFISRRGIRDMLEGFIIRTTCTARIGRDLHVRFSVVTKKSSKPL
jgi:hypothetical protein